MSPIRLSVSHSADIVAVAFARAPIGVDVERLDGRITVDELAPAVLSDSEANALAAFKPEERERAFLVCWTRKEALVKATEDGLRLPLRKIVVSAANKPARLITWPCAPAPQAVSLFDLPVASGYVASVAVIGACSSVRQLDGEPLLRAWREPDRTAS